MSIPKPVTGSVIGYNYLWKHQHERGETEGRKSRPCAVLLCISTGTPCEQVLVLPITHSKPLNIEFAVGIPAKTRRRLGLDEEPCWVICSEMNKFSWPGYDLAAVPHKPLNTYLYGTLPKKLFEEIKEKAILSARGKNTQEGIEFDKGPRLVYVARD